MAAATYCASPEDTASAEKRVTKQLQGTSTHATIVTSDGTCFTQFMRSSRPLSGLITSESVKMDLRRAQADCCVVLDCTMSPSILSVVPLLIPCGGLSPASCRSPPLQYSITKNKRGCGRSCAQYSLSERHRIHACWRQAQSCFNLIFDFLPDAEELYNVGVF